MRLENRELIKERVNMWCFICPVWNYYDYTSVYFGVINWGARGE